MLGTRGVTRSAGTLILAALLAASLLATVAPAPVRAASDALSITSRASYALDPDAGVVHVVVNLTAKNNKPNLVEQTPNGTLTTRYFYESASIAIQPEAARVVATSGRARLTMKLRRQEDFSVLEVRFPRDLFYAQTAKIRVTYDLPGGKPRSDSDIRVGSAFATFYVWAFGDSGNVTVTIPAGFEVETTGEALTKSIVRETTSLSASGISNVDEWYAVIVADRHAALTTDRIDLPDGEHLVVRAWPEDETWRTEVQDLLRRGLPVLAEKVGLEWPVSGDIEVAEVHTPLLEGYAGVFYPSEDRIEISEDLDELTIIHEASHAWFNSKLFVGRWIDEGLADEYASRVLDDVSSAEVENDPVTADGPGHVSLNDWTHPGRIADEETDARERFGYAASWRVIDELIADIGEDGMRAVLAAADRDRVAYVGAGDPETVAIPNDWRRFLDLLDEAGKSTVADDLFRRWVVTADQATLLDARAIARQQYQALIDAGKGWLPGYAVRDPMGRWQFERAARQIAEAAAVLSVRDQIAALATRLGVAAPSSLRAAYEGATESFDDARTLAASQLASARALAAARDRVTGERGLLTSIGLIGEDPAAELAEAATAFASGDLGATTARADAAASLIDEAPAAGRARAAVGGLVGIGLVGAGLAGIVMARRRRRASAETAAGPATEPTSGPATELTEPSEPYATLGAPATAEPPPVEPAMPEHPQRVEGEDS